ncbi:hypothetical protein AB205_0122990 [Aquarana catesbeiana]|uniref:Oxysterol-binding protein n=1 Tax=Aquarana catesbeiana TaxID=8400 RepID=A0A2G9SAI7_AQUCT|nr:hypothetical protein AB205_0122990 [Aquarana catesbeiana]
MSVCGCRCNSFVLRAAAEDDPYSRMKQVLKWYLSGFYKKPKGIKKPYNSILGEKFRCCWFHPQTNSHTFYIAEQVSHHPPVSAFHVSNRKDGFCITGSILARSRFYGNSLSAILDGNARLTFLTREEDYIITMPYAHCKGLLYGTMTMELGGKVTIECEKTGYVTELEFKLKPFFGGSDTLNQISGKIKVAGELLASLDGHWDREVYLNDVQGGDRDIFWNPTSDIRRQRLKRHIVLFEEQTEMESESAIHDGNQNQATDEKYIIEDAQRKSAKERKDKDEEWMPQLFIYDDFQKEWRYKHEDPRGYPSSRRPDLCNICPCSCSMRPWNPLTDIAQYEKDGMLQTVKRNLTSMLAPRTNLAHKIDYKKNNTLQRIVTPSSWLKTIKTNHILFIPTLLLSCISFSYAHTHFILDDNQPTVFSTKPPRTTFQLFTTIFLHCFTICISFL